MLRIIMHIAGILILVAIAVSLVATTENGVLTGIGILLLVAIIYMFVHHDPIVKGRLFFVIFFLLLTAVIALLLPIQSDTAASERLWALTIGAGASLIVTVIFFFLTVYTASIQVLLSNQEEDLTIWQSVWSLASVLLGINQEWVVISEGERTTTNAKGLLKKLGGPGKVVIEPGNAAIFVKGGKITRVAGPGVTLTKRVERIKQIFNLRNQFKIQTVENVITADKIPLTIVMGIPYRIKQAADPNAPEVLADNMGGFPVEPKTLLTAFYNNTAAGWAGLAAGAPTVQLRDQIMARTLDKLFTQDGAPNEREIKVIEDAIKEAVKGFPDSKGVEILGADIREIKMPDDIKQAYIQEQADRKYNEAAADLLTRIWDVARRTEKSEEIMLDAVKAIIEKRKLVEMEGTKIVNIGATNPVEMPLEVGENNG